MRTDLFIDNEWLGAASGEKFAVINPATEAVLAEVAKADAEDVDRAVESSRRCFESDEWQNMAARDRGKLLAKAADILQQRLEDIAKLETQQNGKPYFESKIDISMSVETLRYYAGWTDKLTGETLPVSGSFFTYTLREPVGVVAGIVPWNFPLNLASWKFAPALAAGCTIIIKPASETPLTALAMAEVMNDAGFPPGAFNVITGGGSTVGSALVKHPGVDKISFTGSTEVGKGLMRDAADTLKRVTLELGGKSPNIVFEDADIKAATRGAINGIFYGKGEVCAAGSRLLVQSSVHDELVEQLAARAAKLVPGDPFNKDTRLGAVVSKGQQETVMAYIGSGKSEATLVAGGNAATVDGKGYFVEATVFADAKTGMKIVDEEIFGPVLSVMKFDDEEEGIALANNTEYGLASGVWTRDVAKAHRVARAIRAGTVWVNTYNFYDPAAPFGGYKASGFGRTLGKLALDGYTENKTVWIGL
ncbi:MAG: aldehyde dehydrogenase family protein [Gemmatimonadetes bacterium]|nr:aldehyde dehydrogenase family protein [Gemmatimonadota bacterium]